MKRQPVKSSNVKSVGYDRMTYTLEVEFNSGQVYHYATVPEDVVHALLHAPSIGSFLSRNIKPRFAATKVTEEIAVEPTFTNVSPEQQAAYTGKPAPKQVPSVGRIVHYVDAYDQHVPAAITRVWSDTCVNLRVLHDSDVPPAWRTSVPEDAAGAAGTWHWPEYVPAR